MLWVSFAAIVLSYTLGACSAREGIDIDDPEIAKALEKHEEALTAYEEVAEVKHAWSTTADLLRLSRLALEDGEPEQSLKYSSTAMQEAELAYKQYTQQYEYADVMGLPLRCAVYFPELDCPGYAAYAEANAPAPFEETYGQDEYGDPDPAQYPGQAPAQSPGQAPAQYPSRAPAQVITDASPPGTPSVAYTVVKGDSLWKISAKESIYGDPFRWPLIFKANASKIKDADLIFPKQRFNIFQGFDATAIDRAVLHARTRGAWLVGEREAADDDYLSAQ